MSDTFNALVARQQNDKHSVAFETLTPDELDPGDVTIAVDYSTVNYKDGLAITGAAPIVQRYPLVLGIDFSGTVIESKNPGFQEGDRVVLNGFGASERLHGGYAERAQVDGSLLVKLPESISNRQAMAIGTAGYTAMLCVLAIQDAGAVPESGPVLVTGAAGGVGTIAISLLTSLGFEVTASTGREEEAEFLKSLGANEVLDRQALSEAGKPLQREKWGAVVDCVGSHTLINAIAQARYGGAVAACGLAQGADLPGTVMPFILRSVKLLGVDSVQAPLPARQRAWEALATTLDTAKLESLCFELPFDQVPNAAQEILKGQIRGRGIVAIN
ncbi:MAG: MDR family oxidoreductase [Pseudomonadota bacterium]